MTASADTSANLSAGGVGRTPVRRSGSVNWFSLLLLAPLAAFLLVMVVYPLVMAILSSLGLAQPVQGLPESFTLEGYREFFDPGKPALVALWFTFKVTLITAITSTVTGVALAIYLKLRDIDLPVALSFIIKLPLFTPYLVIAFIFWVLLYPAGYIVNILSLLKDFIADYYLLFEQKPMLVNDPFGIAIILCATWMRFPYGFIMAQNLLAMIDPSYEEAARNLGASRRIVVWRIFLPLTKYRPAVGGAVELPGPVHRLLDSVRARGELAAVPVGLHLRERQGPGRLALGLHRRCRLRRNRLCHRLRVFPQPGAVPGKCLGPG